MLGTPTSAATMAVEAIRGYPAGHRVTPNMGDYAALRPRFTWEGARRELEGLPAGGLNIAHEAVDRHAAGERVYVLTGRIPELYIAALGAWKNRSVVCTLFSAFGPEPIRARMALGDARVLVTTPALYQKKIAPILNLLPGLRHVLLAGKREDNADIAGTFDFGRLLDGTGEQFNIAAT